MATPSTRKPSFPEDEEMDPVGKPYPEQEKDGDDPPHPPHPPFSPDTEPDIPQDPESKRTVMPDSPKN